MAGRDKIFEIIRPPRISDIIVQSQPSIQDNTNVVVAEKPQEISYSRNIDGINGDPNRKWTTNAMEDYPYSRADTQRDVFNRIKSEMQGDVSNFPRFVERTNPTVYGLPSGARAAYIDREGDRGIVVGFKMFDKMPGGVYSGYMPFWAGQPGMRSSISHEMGHVMESQGSPRTRAELDTILALSEILRDKESLEQYQKDVEAGTQLPHPVNEPLADMMGSAVESYLSHLPSESRRDSVLKGLTIPEGSYILRNAERYMTPEGELKYLPRGEKDSILLDELNKRFERALTYFTNDDLGVTQDIDEVKERYRYPFDENKMARKMLSDIISSRRKMSKK